MFYFPKHSRQQYVATDNPSVLRSPRAPVRTATVPSRRLNQNNNSHPITNIIVIIASIGDASLRRKRLFESTRLWVRNSSVSSTNSASSAHLVNQELLVVLLEVAAQMGPIIQLQQLLPSRLVHRWASSCCRKYLGLKNPARNARVPKSVLQRNRMLVSSLDFIDLRALFSHSLKFKWKHMYYFAFIEYLT